MTGRLRTKVRAMIESRREERVAALDPTAPVLQNLAPDYSFADHGVYFTMLSTALRDQHNVHNIALAGTYGTGKSSILRETARVFAPRVVQVSLLSLGTEPEMNTSAVAATKTNRIQREIVKQLLYQQSPARAPESRFRRIGRYRWGTEMIIALTVALLAVVTALLLGIDVVTRPQFGLTVIDRPHLLTLIAALVGIGLLAGAVTLLVRAFGRGRVGIEKLSAGPATISLSPRSLSFFDEYLDEIIYFFETNRRADILIIEDLDRFDDPNIFESLRSLNGLLNSAKQLKGRNIRFIYAMRDSVFEKLDAKALAELDDEARAELVRANRTKFFDLVIPVVPFITHRNARDLMHEHLVERGHDVSKDLVHLVSRHLADMRLVHNILNEFEVYKHRLLDVPTPVPGLDVERLFAMVVYKNAHMGDFEKIRLGSSALDNLWDVWRAIVAQGTKTLRADSDRLRARIANREAEANYARDLGTSLSAKIGLLAEATGTGFAGSAIYFEGSEVSLSKLQTSGFWRRVIDTGLPLQVHAYHYGEYGSSPMDLTAVALSELLGKPLDAARFVSSSEQADRAQIVENDVQVSFLQRHSWKELAQTRDRYAQSAGGRSRTFQQWVRRKLPSRLAADLVTHGYITEYFSLHVSAFYGRLIRPAAMMYVLKSIERGQADAGYALDADDVDAILRDQGRTVLAERSMLNVGVMDRLLDSDPEATGALVETMLAVGQEGDEFRELYLSGGAKVPAFVEALTPRDPRVFTLLAGSNALESAGKVALIDVAIRAAEGSVVYETSGDFVRLMEVNYTHLASLKPAAAADTQRACVALLASQGVLIQDITSLPMPALEAMREHPAFHVNASNLTALAGSPDVSFDALRQLGVPLEGHVLSDIEGYIQIFAEEPPESKTVKSAAILADLLNGDTPWTRSQLDVLLGHADDACVLSDLSEIEDPQHWPAILRWGRAEATWSNLRAYLAEFDEIDADAAASLQMVSAIDVPDDADDDERSKVALAIVNSTADDLSPSIRVSLVASLGAEQLDGADLVPTRGTLIGDLLAAGLLLDDADAFDERLMVDWPTLHAAIQGSSEFPTFLSTSTLAPKYIAQFFDANELEHLHAPAAAILTSYGALSADAYEAVARRVADGGVPPSHALMGLLRRGGASDAVTIGMLHTAGDEISDDELRDIFRQMGDPWAAVADPGWGIHELDEMSGLEPVLARLHEAGSVSKWPLEGAKRRVSLHQPS